MKPAPRPGHEGLHVGKPVVPEIKELTITLGDADLYINCARRVDVGNGHSLFEALLTDPSGSRPIYIDNDDILELLRDLFIGVPPAPANAEDPPARPKPRS